MLKVSLRTLDRWSQAGLLRFSKLGHGPKAPIRYRRGDIEQFMNSHASITKQDVRELMGKDN
jgi:predicted site-specific integrase-resolvase